MDNLQEENIEEENVESESNSFYSKKKKLIWLLIIVVLFIIIGVAITNKKDNSNYSKANILFDSNVESIMLGTAKRITASIIDNPIYEVRYHSSNDNIINVDKYGLVEGIGLGSANLKAYYFDVNGKEHFIEKKITVFEGNSNIDLVDVSFPDGEVVVKLYGEYNLGNKLIVSPSSGYIYNKVFRSSNEEVVSVNPNGKLVGISEGEAIVNVRINDKFDSNIRVYVTEDTNSSEILKLPESIIFDNVTVKLKVGELKNLGYSLKPKEAVSRFLTWKSSDTTVAVIDNGMLTAVGEGNCDITLSSINGKSAKIFVEVTEPTNVEKITFNEKSIVIKENDTYKLTPVVDPKNAIDKKLTFTSDNEKVAKIDVANESSVIIRGISEGKATIKVKSSNGVSSSIKVSVTGKDSKDVSDDNGTIAVRINETISPAKVYSDNIAVTNPANITITMRGSVEMVKYCYAPYSNAICNPNIVYKNSFNIPSGNIYRLRIQKFDAKGREIVGSNNDNYYNGALEYYINTSDNYYKDLGYTINGNYYSTVADANKNIVTTNVKLDFKFINTVTDKLKICYTTGSVCDPDNSPNVIINKDSNNKYVELTDNGLWKVYVSEYSNNNKVGVTKKYYVNVKKNDENYLIHGNYFYTALDASNNSVNGTQRISFELNNENISKIKICFTNSGGCDPNLYPDKTITKDTISNYIDISGSGLFSVHVAEYNNANKLVAERIYYLSIK